jgi:hypothetical protein
MIAELEELYRPRPGLPGVWRLYDDSGSVVATVRPPARRWGLIAYGGAARRDYDDDLEYEYLILPSQISSRDIVK